MHDLLGIYISVPFCKAKCSFCNFASDAFAPDRMQDYVERVVKEIHSAHKLNAGRGLVVPRHVGSVYLGGGTPSLLPPKLLNELFLLCEKSSM